MNWVPLENFEYRDAGHPCPECDSPLRLFHPSRMVICDGCDSDPLYLVGE